MVRATDEALVTVEKHTVGELLSGGSVSRVWRGCSERRGTLVELERGETSFSGGRSARYFRLAGPIVGYLVSAGNRYEAETYLTVVNLDTGERWSSERENHQTGRLIGLTEIAVNRFGNAAWIRQGYGDRGRREWRLFVRRGAAVSLRHRSRHELTRLTLGNLRVRWSERGKRRKRSL